MVILTKGPSNKQLKVHLLALLNMTPGEEYFYKKRLVASWLFYFPLTRLPCSSQQACNNGAVPTFLLLYNQSRNCSKKLCSNTNNQGSSQRALL
jgi:hypothetical protein